MRPSKDAQANVANSLSDEDSNGFKVKELAQANPDCWLCLLFLPPPFFFFLANKAVVLSIFVVVKVATADPSEIVNADVFVVDDDNNTRAAESERRHFIMQDLFYFNILVWIGLSRSSVSSSSLSSLSFLKFLASF